MPLASDEDHAGALYRWNIELTAALTPLAGDVEITLRNAIHDQLATHLGAASLSAPPSQLLDA